jgi:hypothetical protein
MIRLKSGRGWIVLSESSAELAEQLMRVAESRERLLGVPYPFEQRPEPYGIVPVSKRVRVFEKVILTFSDRFFDFESKMLLSKDVVIARVR